MNEIVEYIKNHYAPLVLIVYGSYADGSNNQSSDFDALVISENHREFHDVSFVSGVQLDVFVYPASYFKGQFDCGKFIQLHDSEILFDTDEMGAKLKRRVLSYIKDRSHKSDEEIRNQITWCRKMLLRTKRGDTEGMFRWHWVLIDSLEFFCDKVDHPYWGPKKTLRWMETAYPEAFLYYKKALFDFDEDSLEKWILYLELEPFSAGYQRNHGRKK